MRRSNPIDRLRKICATLPEATEKEAWGAPTFRVRGKMFAMFVDNHHDDGIEALWCKAPPGAQEIVVGAAPEKFFVPPYVGHKGWIGIRLDGDVDWGEVAEFMKDAHEMTAPAPRRQPVRARPATRAARASR